LEANRRRLFREIVMAIEWQKVERAGGAYSDWLAVVDGPGDTEIAADYGPIMGNRISYQATWRRKTPAYQAVPSQLTVQLAVEGYAPTLEVAKATCERLIQSLQQITQDSPGILQTLHSAAT
jgi:hypothetical protein